MRGESEVPGGVLNLISTNYPDHGHHGRLPLKYVTMKAELSHELRVWPFIYIAQPFRILVKFAGLNHVFVRGHLQLGRPSEPQI